jgi:aspartyl/glutamyl-tRNA(Asn/Gln) amidotransferase C subunit
MSNNIDIVAKFAKLSKLAPSDSNAENFEKYTSFFRKEDFEDVIKMIHSVEKINTEGVPYQFLFFDDHQSNIESFQRSREDKVVMNNTRDDLLSNAKSKMGYYIVPKVIDSES